MQAHIIVDGRLELTEDLEVIRAAHAAGRTLWVELGEHTPAAEQLLTETFGVHPLVVEDIFRDRSVPKIDDLDGYLYVVVHALGSNDDPALSDVTDLDLVIGADFILTQHREGPATERFRARLEASPELLGRGVAWVAHAFIDMVVDRFLPFMDTLMQRADDAERRVMAAAFDDSDLLPELIALKRRVRAVWRIAHHQRDILRLLSRSDYAEIPPAARIYFRDVYDHFLHVAEEADTYKDIVDGAIEAHLNAQSYRMNDTVKRLTLISTVMLPLNLIAGLYGMNFTSLPGLAWRWGFLGVVGAMVGVGSGVWWYFKYRRWA